MKHTFLVPIGTFVAGVTLALGAAVFFLRIQPQQALSLVGATLPTTPEASAAAPKLEVSPEQQHRLELSRSFSAVIGDVQNKQGWDLDQYAFNDLISINQNTVGLLRKISADASDPQLKALAQQIQAQRSEEVDALNRLQSATGHSRHLH
jgi:predicted outer membrane protein